jgi:hypothetical protein
MARASTARFSPQINVRNTLICSRVRTPIRRGCAIDGLGSDA